MAVVDLGFYAEEFLGLWPAALVEHWRWQRSRRREDQAMIAQLTACVVNAGFARPKEPVKTSDFLPWEVSEATSKPAARSLRKRRRETVEKLRALLENVPVIVKNAAGEVIERRGL